MNNAFRHGGGQGRGSHKATQVPKAAIEVADAGIGGWDIRERSSGGAKGGREVGLQVSSHASGGDLQKIVPCVLTTFV